MKDNTKEGVLSDVAGMDDGELSILAEAIQQIKSQRAAGNENAGVEEQEGETKETILEKLKALRDTAKLRVSKVKTKIVEKTDEAVEYAKENPVKAGAGIAAFLTAAIGVIYFLNKEESTEE